MVKYCPKCGSQLYPGAKYCGSCGANINLNNIKQMRGSSKQSIKRVGLPILAVIIVIILSLAGFNALVSVDESTIRKEFTTFTGPDGTEIEAPLGSVSSDVKFSITKLDPDDVPDLPEWAEGENEAYNFSVDQPLLSPVTVKVPLPDAEVVMLGHYNDEDKVWEILPFGIEDGKAIAEVDSFSIFEPIITTMDNIIDSTANAIRSVAENALIDPLQRYLNCEGSIDVASSDASWISGCANFIAGDEVLLTVYNDAPIHRYFYPIEGDDVVLKKTSVFPVKDENGAIIDPHSKAEWVTYLEPGESVTFAVGVDKNSYFAMFEDSVGPARLIRGFFENWYFSINGREPTIQDLESIMATAITGSGIPFASFIAETGGSVFFQGTSTITFTRQIESDHIINLSVTTGSTFARIFFTTLESSSSELWIELPSGWEQVYDISSNVYGTYDHYYEVGPLNPDTDYGYRINVKGLSFNWMGTEEIMMSFKTKEHVDKIVEGGGTTDVRYKPKVTISEYDWYTQYTAAIEFGTPDASRCEIQYMTAFPTHELFTTGLFSATIFAVEEQLGIAMTDHKMELTYIMPNCKYLYVIYDCSNKFGYPWEEDTKNLIYFGSFTTPEITY